MTNIAVLDKVAHHTSIFYLLVVLSVMVVIECVSQYFLRNYDRSKQIHWFLAGAALYAFIAYLLSFTFKYNKVIIINILWGGVSAILLTIIAYFLYGETLTWREILGIIIIFTGIILINWK